MASCSEHASFETLPNICPISLQAREVLLLFDIKETLSPYRHTWDQTSHSVMTKRWQFKRDKLWWACQINQASFSWQAWAIWGKSCFRGIGLCFPKGTRWFCRQWFCNLPLEERFIHSGKKYSRTLEVLTARDLSCYVGDASNDLKRRWRLTTSHVYDIFIKW